MTTLPSSPHALAEWLHSADALQCSLHQRNLLWMIASPPILQVSNQASLSCSPALLRSFCSTETGHALEQLVTRNRSHFLGSYYESLWRYLIEADPCLELFAHNLQIHHQGKTIGEFDFLIRDTSTQRWLHQEVAIKFYLLDTQSEPARWRGPNARDRLDLKRAKLSQQQLVLSEHPIAQQTLVEKGIHAVVAQSSIQGYLFYPSSTCLQPYDETEHLHPHHLRGTWHTIDSLMKMMDDLPQEEDDIAWLILSDKQQWLAPCVLAHSSRVLNHSLLRRELVKLSGAPFKPLLIVELARADRAWVEAQRLFLVPDGWPRLSKPAPAL